MTFWLLLLSLSKRSHPIKLLYELLLCGALLFNPFFFLPAYKVLLSPHHHFFVSLAWWWCGWYGRKKEVQKHMATEFSLMEDFSYSSMHSHFSGFVSLSLESLGWYTFSVACLVCGDRWQWEYMIMGHQHYWSWSLSNN